MKKFVILEDVEIIANGERILLEVGDILGIEDGPQDTSKDRLLKLKHKFIHTAKTMGGLGENGSTDNARRPNWISELGGAESVLSIFDLAIEQSPDLKSYDLASSFVQWAIENGLVRPDQENLMMDVITAELRRIP